jgi:hypothetical protein
MHDLSTIVECWMLNCYVVKCWVAPPVTKYGLVDLIITKSIRMAIMSVMLLFCWVLSAKLLNGEFKLVNWWVWVLSW